MRVQTAEHIIIIISDISHFAQEAGSTSGLIAGEWKGKESLLINRIVIIGPGHCYYWWCISYLYVRSEKIYNRKNTQNRHQQAIL